ncbi:pentatricopeptide repeat protein [Ophiocordyceps camponoti-floridani]|uniref:Pentatricopeptide repeat protein n=1 Tax=Ophiocordyceps camponoti-floridani TaxID=2030778 RepID=A0A8H4Q3T4_9HYPO|nr:pentatricopeptide repeat protein [Ophiocordyceps camponoti-floridani]
MVTGILRCSSVLRKLVVAEFSPSSYSALLLRGRRQPYSTISDAAVYDLITENVTEDAPNRHKRILEEDSQDQTQTTPSLARLQRIVHRHLSHMEDPWKIAQYVQATLDKDRFEEALLLVQTASRDRAVEVSWNQLIAYQIKKKQLKKAIQLFNEMKKRGQLPNVSSYTILINGCAASEHPKLAVSEAVKQYQVLLSSPRLKANTIHLNCTLNVCYRAGDLESLFIVADSINDTNRAPDASTYGIILNALRQDAVTRTDGLPHAQQEALKHKAIDRGKGIWQEVMSKWKGGRLNMDEGLACAMGRLLLITSQRSERPKVLDILQQALNVPNLCKKPLDDTDPFEDPAMKNIALRETSSKTRQAVPGRNTLSLILTMLASCKMTTVGIKYWNLMVRHYGVVPDRDNWYRMLGMTKVSRNSTYAAELLELVPDEFVCGKPFQIAMAAGIRDSVNTNVMTNVDKALDIMLRRLPLPDMLALRLYLRVALVSHSRFRGEVMRGHTNSGKHQYGAQIAAALARLWEPYKQSYYHYFKVEPKPPGRRDVTDELYNSQREVMALARGMYRAMAKLVNEGLLPKEELKEMRRRGAKINREIQTFYADREKLEPKLRPNGRSGEPDPDLSGLSTASPPLSDDEALSDFDDEDLLPCSLVPESEKDDDQDLVQKFEWEWDTTKPVKLPPTQSGNTTNSDCCGVKAIQRGMDF